MTEQSEEANLLSDEAGVQEQGDRTGVRSVRECCERKYTQNEEGAEGDILHSLPYFYVSATGLCMLTVSKTRPASHMGCGPCLFISMSPDYQSSRQTQFFSKIL